MLASFIYKVLVPSFTTGIIIGIIYFCILLYKNKKGLKMSRKTVVRAEIPGKYVEKAIAGSISELTRRIKEKGQNGFSGKHEIYGLLCEECDEVLDALRLDDRPDLFIDELYDVIVVAMFGIATILYMEDSEDI